MTVLVTGAAGFIGFHVARALLVRGERVVGLDNLNDYYDVRLKEARLALLQAEGRFRFLRASVADRAALAALVEAEPGITRIIHLAAQAGVRHSLVDPYAYVEANVMGQVTVLEAARRLKGLVHIVYASSSSVYGGNERMPFAEADRVDTPLSLYAATKRALPQTGLRFFTVYGPWGRPDMAYYAFARAIAAGEPITLYDGGRLRRDFTYVDDVVEGVLGCLDRPPPGSAPRLLNIGNHQSEAVATLVGLLEAGLGRRAVVRDAPAPATEVAATFAETAAIAALTGFAPRTPLAEGIPRFVAWFRRFHGIGAAGTIGG
jgi:UDP-glucuronate 4-epimerase